MKRLVVGLIVWCGMAMTGTAAGEDVDGRIKELISKLATLTDMADGCGEHMNYYGKKALTGEVCKEFKQAFYAEWPSREALQQEVSDYVLRLEQGKLKCENCRVMLQRVEELRITVTYYLDYMDFVKEF